MSDTRNFWSRAVNVMFVITVGLGIVILSTQKGAWRTDTNDTPKMEVKPNKIVPQKETKKKVTKVDKKVAETILMDSVKIDDNVNEIEKQVEKEKKIEKQVEKQKPKHSDSTWIKSDEWQYLQK